MTKPDFTLTSIPEEEVAYSPRAPMWLMRYRGEPEDGVRFGSAALFNYSKVRTYFLNNGILLPPTSRAAWEIQVAAMVEAWRSEREA